jgi:hypothetical protein
MGIRREMTITGHSAPGAVRTSVHVGSDDYALDVPSSRLPERLRPRGDAILTPRGAG